MAEHFICPTEEVIATHVRITHTRFHFPSPFVLEEIHV
jgi:hypothetical protein